MPEISIIIPMYKTPKLCLRKCLDSVLSQSFTDFEVLVIDDGNAPGYEYIQKEYELLDTRIHFIRQDHSGVSIARNLGLKKAKGKFISFLDSDDYIDPSFLTEMYNAISVSDMAVCAVSEQYYPVHPGLVDCHVFWSKPSFYNGLQYINFCHNKMFRKDLIIKYDICFQPGVKLGEDALFLADYMEKCKIICMVREPRYHYVPEENSAMRRYRREYWEWEKQVIERQWNLFHQYPLSVFEEQAMDHWLYMKMRYLFTYYSRGEKDNKVRREIIYNICHSDLFKRLEICKLRRHAHLRLKDKVLLLLWKTIGPLNTSKLASVKFFGW